MSDFKRLPLEEQSSILRAMKRKLFGPPKSTDPKQWDEFNRLTQSYVHERMQRPGIRFAYSTAEAFQFQGGDWANAYDTAMAKQQEQIAAMKASKK